MVMIEFFSVGMLSYFYKDMITEDKKVIAMPKMPNDYDYIADRKLFSQLLMLKFLYPDNMKWDSKFIFTLKALIYEYFNGG